MAPLDSASLDGEVAVRASLRNRGAKWPTRVQQPNRLYPHCEPIVTPRFRFSRQDSVFAIGSCFARNVEEYLERLGLNVVSLDIAFPSEEMSEFSRPNSLLVKYTPPTITWEIETAIKYGGHLPDEIVEQCLLAVGPDQYVDLQLPVWLATVTRERAYERRQQIAALFHRAMTCDVIVMTLGLIESWIDRETGLHINSTPTNAMMKAYPNRFGFDLLDIDRTREYVVRALDVLQSANPSAKIVLTTSPVPLARTFTDMDVIVANTYSKSMLRVISQEMRSRYAGLDYFPSYEMVINTENEFAWGEDLRHVLDARVGEVISTFATAYLDGAEDEIIRAGEIINAARIKRLRNDYEGASAILADFPESLKDDIPYLRELGVVLHHLKRPDDARSTLERLYEKGDRDRVPMMALASLLVGSGRYDFAIKILEDLVKAHSRRIGIWLLLAEACVVAGETASGQSAASRLKRMIVNSPSQRERWVCQRAAAVMVRLGRKADAEAIIAKSGGPQKKIPEPSRAAS